MKKSLMGNHCKHLVSKLMGYKSAQINAFKITVGQIAMQCTKASLRPINSQKDPSTSQFG